MKRLVTILSVLLVAGAINAQRTSLQLGFRAGLDSWLTNGAIHSAPGVIGGADLSVTFLGSIGNKAFLGPRIGFSVSYASSYHLLDNYSEAYTNVDYYRENLDYTITATRCRETHRQMQVEIPLMLEFQTLNGFCLALGAKWMMPLNSRHSILLTNPYVLTYYPDFEVNVYNELVTGKLVNPTEYVGGGVLPIQNVLLSGDVGYEWKKPYTKFRVGVHAYVDYGVWNNYKNEPPMQRLVDIAPIMNTEYPVPDIKINFLTTTYCSRLNYLSAGLRLTLTLLRDSEKCRPCSMSY